MSQPKNAMEIYQLLNKSNCRQCGFKTCLAFAGAVYLGQRHLADCPSVDQATLACCGAQVKGPSDREFSLDELVKQIKTKLVGVDWAAAAERTGGRWANGWLSINILGKEVHIDPEGRLRTDIHINPWVIAPIFSYLLDTQGIEPSGQWISFRELEGGRDRYPLFQKRCEAAMKQVADRYPDFFKDLVELFGAKQLDQPFTSDLSMVLHPLPKLPIMICYSLAEEGIASTLTICFDAAANQNLEIGAIFNLATGLAQMFEKIARRHGVTMPTG